MPMMNSKFRAMLLHLTISILLIVICCFVALKIWFPYPLYYIDGTLKALVTLVVVDVCIGPLLTFIVFSNKKSVKELVFDSTVIALIQLSALSFGILKLYEQRIISLVHVDGAFHPITAISVGDKPQNQALNEYRNIVYGMITDKDLIGLNEAETLLALSTPEKYRVLTKKEMQIRNTPQKMIPKKLKQQYGDDYFYKTVAGKDKHGVVVIDSNMNIVDIALREEGIE